MCWKWSFVHTVNCEILHTAALQNVLSYYTTSHKGKIKPIKGVKVEFLQCYYIISKIKIATKFLVINT